MEDKTGMTEPLVSDEQLCGRVEIGKIGDHVRGMHRPPGPLPVIRQTPMTAEEVRDTYEAERSNDKARIASLSAQVKAMREAGNAMHDKAGIVLNRASGPHTIEHRDLDMTLIAWTTATASLDTPTPTPPKP